MYSMFAGETPQGDSEVNTHGRVSVRSNNILSFIMLMLRFDGSVLAPVSNSTVVSSKI